MAFNPQAFESVYGFEMLDTLHNFFPEIMYDDTIFSSASARWMRYRLETLFPRVYVRQSSIYQLYSAAPRRRNYNTWVLEDALRTNVIRYSASTPTSAPTQAQMSATPVTDSTESTVAATSTIGSAAPTPTTAPSPPQINSNRTRYRTRWIPEPSLFSFGYDYTNRIDNDNILTNVLNYVNMFNTGLQDVVVSASAAEINAGSSTRAHTDISNDTVCSICQEHGDTPEQWRILRCSHTYHTRCIDTWFARDVHCPICRTDIRSYSAEADTGGTL